MLIISKAVPNKQKPVKNTRLSGEMMKCVFILIMDWLNSE